jgi:hypothetical protein
MMFRRWREERTEEMKMTRNITMKSIRPMFAAPTAALFAVVLAAVPITLGASGVTMASAFAASDPSSPDLTNTGSNSGDKQTNDSVDKSMKDRADKSRDTSKDVAGHSDKDSSGGSSHDSGKGGSKGSSHDSGGEGSDR